ncbi:predicted protein [Naegleria gruberi]|uniref:Predicted protein n=1 Tax=Naegleria gruberi TaxID=5762 RepID=D2VEZ1_NAEGR|nr:uncharacterized protein NAEGRDRAFT_58001 [Naegleria gruberi]EFC44687.1 predicted protein [Naegleria gruberi]|eukprot:XP_002677431.1 predicted protein [Naegleria gruberi strain NEG-M]
MTILQEDIFTFATSARLASSDNVMANKTIRELASQFRKCKNMKEMRLCLTQLEKFASSSGNTTPNVALYSIALEMAIKEQKLEDVRKIWATLKNNLSMVDVQTLSSIILFFGRYYKQYPEQVKNIFTNNQCEGKRKSNEKKKLVTSPLYDENSPIEYTQLFFLKRQDPETLVKIAPLTIASAMMHEQWKLASVMIYETVEAILEYDEVLKCSKKNEFLGEFEDSSSFGDNYGSSNKLDPESIELMTDFINSSLRLITRKVRQGMIKISAYTAMSSPKNNQLPVHVTSSEEIYKDTATSIMEGLALGLDALNLAIFETKTQNSAHHPMNLDEELCTKLYCMIHSFRVFIDCSPYKKLQEKFRKRVIFKTDNVDDYLTLKYGSYLEKLHIKEDPYVQFRMEYKVNLDKNGEIKSDISNAYVNPNPIPSGSTLILNKLHSVDSTTATVIVEGRSYKTPGELNAQHTVEEQQVPLEQEEESKLTILDDFIDEPDEDGINDKDFCSNNATGTTQYSAEGVAHRFLTAILDFMGKNAQNPSEIYQLLAQTGSVLLLQTEEFPKYLSQYIEIKFQDADKEFANNAPMNFQAKYQITVQLFNFATFLQNVRLPAIIPYLSPILTPEEQRKIDYKLSDAPQVKQYDFNHFQEISIAALEALVQSNRSPIQTSDYKESTNCNKTKIPPQIASDSRFILMAPKIEIQLASLYLQRSYSPFQVMKDMKSLTQEFPPLYSHNHEKFYRSNNEDIAMYYLKSALNVVTVQNSPDDFAVCYSQLAHLLKQKKKYDEAIKAFQKVLEVRKPNDTDPTKYASLCMNIANTYLAKIEENKSQNSEERKSSAQVAKFILNEYVIGLRDTLKLEKRKESPSDISNHIKTIDTAIEWFDKSEAGFSKLKTAPTQQDPNRKELSTKDHYLGLVNINLGYAHLLKTKLYMQLLEEKVDATVLKTAHQAATKAATILKAALEVIKPDLKEKDSIMQKTKQMGSESFPKVNIYLAEIYLYLSAFDTMEGITDTVNGLDYLEEARSCLDLGATLFMNKEMKEWKVRLNILTFEVYHRMSENIIEGLPFIQDEPTKQQLTEKKDQFTERSINCLKDAIKDYESTISVDENSDSELSSLIEQLKL